MAEMAVFLCGWQPQMRETQMVCNLQLPHRDLFQINLEFRINRMFSGENLVSCLVG